MRLYKARKKALDLIKADHKASYSKLDRYMATIIQMNLGQQLTYKQSGRLRLNFLHSTGFLFDAQRRGFFYGCRHFIGLDGCHLRGTYKGVSLAIVAIYSNFNMYPLAVAIVENENQYS